MEAFGMGLLIAAILLVGLLGGALDKISKLEEENSRLRDLLRDFNIPDRDKHGRFTKRRPF